MQDRTGSRWGLLPALLLAAACGGKSRVLPAGSTAASAGTTGAGPTESAGGGGSSTDPDLGNTGALPQALVQVIAEGPWQVGQETTGIAVDAYGTIFISDAEHVFRIDGDMVTEYLSLYDLARAGVGTPENRFRDLDIGPDQALYVVADGIILMLSDAHEFEVMQVITSTTEDLLRARIGVLGPRHLLLARGDGLLDVEGEGSSLLYGADELKREAQCTAEDLAVAPDGMFLYQAGCNPSPLMRGDADGSGVSVLYEAGRRESTPISASNFLCTARDPAGGFYVVTRNATGLKPLLYHVAANPSSMDDALYVPTTPTLAAMQDEEWADSLAFYFCSIAVAPDGSIVFQTFSQLWRIGPG